MSRSISVDDGPLEIRRFICPKCGDSYRHYIYQRIGALYVNCSRCSLNYFFDWNTDSFRELGMYEKEFDEPFFEMIDEEDGIMDLPSEDAATALGDKDLGVDQFPKGD